MYPFKAFLFLITICVAKSKANYKTMCKNDYYRVIDGKNNQIDVLEYCSYNLCIEKCCGPGEILVPGNKCLQTTKIFIWWAKHSHITYLEYQFNSTNILSSLDVMKSKKNVVFVQNHRKLFNCTGERPGTEHYKISENGSVWWTDSVSKKIEQIEKLDYCIDHQLYMKPDNSPSIKIIIRQTTMDPQDTEEIESFEIVALLISTFFLMLVLVVYCLLPDHRSLADLVLMAYTFSLLFAFINKLILTFVKRDPPKGFCKKFSPVVYFAFLSSIFWLSAISFEIWWGLRSLRKRHTSKRGDLVKFMWYGLYAWGTPLLITAIVTTLDNIDELYLYVKPPFDNCLMNGDPFFYYFKIPIGILIFINIALFVMTVYNLWMVRHAVSGQDSRSSKEQNYKFATFAKLSVMMGLSWCLELLPSVRVLYVYILTNLYNLLIGVAIFYWFVCQKKKLLLLCRRFNIQNEFTKKFESQSSQHNKSRITRTTECASSVKNRSKDGEEENTEMELLKDCPIKASTIV